MDEKSPGFFYQQLRKTLQAISKPSIRFKIKSLDPGLRAGAERGGQPQ